MKTLATVLLSLIVTSVASATLYQSVSTFNEDRTDAQLIITTYSSAMNSAEPNGLKAEVAKLKTELVDAGTINELAASNILQVESGKGSVSQYGSENLVCLSVAMQGTGLIETCGTFFRVYVSTDMGENKTTVTFEEVVEIKKK